MPSAVALAMFLPSDLPMLMALAIAITVAIDTASTDAIDIHPYSEKIF